MAAEVEPEAEASAESAEANNGDSLGADQRDHDEVNQFTFTPGHHPKNSGTRSGPAFTLVHVRARHRSFINPCLFSSQEKPPTE